MIILTNSKPLLVLSKLDCLKFFYLHDICIENRNTTIHQNAILDQISKGEMTSRCKKKRQTKR